jgi:hypothetical protein
MVSAPGIEDGLLGSLTKKKNISVPWMSWKKNGLEVEMHHLVLFALNYLP